MNSIREGDEASENKAENEQVSDSSSAKSSTEQQLTTLTTVIGDEASEDEAEGEQVI